MDASDDSQREIIQKLENEFGQYWEMLTSSIKSNITSMVIIAKKLITDKSFIALNKKYALLDEKLNRASDENRKNEIRKDIIQTFELIRKKYEEKKEYRTGP